LIDLVIILVAQPFITVALFLTIIMILFAAGTGITSLFELLGWRKPTNYEEYDV